jgi:hypothetical protein
MNHNKKWFTTATNTTTSTTLETSLQQMLREMEALFRKKMWNHIVAFGHLIKKLLTFETSALTSPRRTG